ncbi:MAG: hypothetical protein Q4F07_04575 [Bacteroidales bacterium]|nr:hypothetical protein [Bacteroidales bacterium]
MAKDKINIKETDEYPGAEINVADNEKISPKLVKERTKSLNDNPRDNKLDQ